MLQLHKFVTCYFPPSTTPQRRRQRARAGGSGHEEEEDQTASASSSEDEDDGDDGERRSASWMHAFPYDIAKIRESLASDSPPPPPPPLADAAAANDLAVWSRLREGIFRDLPESWISVVVEWNVRSVRRETENGSVWEWGAAAGGDDDKSEWQGQMTFPYELAIRGGAAWTPGALQQTGGNDGGGVFAIIFRFIVHEEEKETDKETISVLLLARLGGGSSADDDDDNDNDHAAVLCTTSPVSNEQAAAMKSFVLFHCVPQLLGGADENDSWQFLYLDLSKLALRQQLNLRGVTSALARQEASTLCIYARVMQYVGVRGNGDVRRVCTGFPAAQDDQWNLALGIFSARDVWTYLNACVLHAATTSSNSDDGTRTPTQRNTKKKNDGHLDLAGDLRAFASKHAGNRLFRYLSVFGGFSRRTRAELVRVPNQREVSSSSVSAVSVSSSSYSSSADAPTDSPAWSRRPLFIVLFVRTNGELTTDVLGASATSQFFGAMLEEYNFFARRVFPDHILWSGLRWLRAFLSEHYLARARTRCLMIPLLFVDADETVDFVQQQQESSFPDGDGDGDGDGGDVNDFLRRALRHAGWAVFRLADVVRENETTPLAAVWEMFIVGGMRGRGKIPPMFESLLGEDITALMGATPRFVTENDLFSTTAPSSPADAGENENNTFLSAALENLLRPFPKGISSSSSSSKNKKRARHHA